MSRSQIIYYLIPISGYLVKVIDLRLADSFTHYKFEQLLNSLGTSVKPLTMHQDLCYLYITSILGMYFVTPPTNISLLDLNHLVLFEVI